MSGTLSFPIVGVGASAGGVEALEGFFRGLPAEPGVAVVVVTHLSPTHDSKLPEIIGRNTSLAVVVAKDGAEVLPNHVYVMAEDAIVRIKAGRLVLRRQNPQRRERHPIDLFFCALAEDCGERAAGIVLSGGDGDGSLGVKAIKQRGGMTLAQTHSRFGPAHPDMPRHAIETGLIDLALPVDEMGPKLSAFAQSLALPTDTPPGATMDANAAADADTGETPAQHPLDAVRPELYAILRNQVGHDFSGYKAKTFLRRVVRRMQITQIPIAEMYIERLRDDSQEVAALFRDLLINVTSFFRGEEAFGSLVNLVIPKLFEGRGAEDTVRIWVPGCSTGEEVFSLAMLLREHMDKLSALPRVQIFATDIDDRALAVARAAHYPTPLLDGLSPARRRRFFLPQGDGYVLSKEVREFCIFSPHSVIRDPPFSRIDLISCRNLLIYFGAEIQSQVIPAFHYALREDGFLFLGSAENVSQFDDLFTPLDKLHRIFRRRSDVATNLRLPMIVNMLRPGPASDISLRRPQPGAAALRQMAEAHVLERFVPPHVVVNRDGDVVYYSARTGKYLAAPGGVPSRQILTLARKGLRLDLRTLFRSAVETGRTVTCESVAVENDGGDVQMVSITIEPLVGGNSAELIDGERRDPLYVILFTDHGPLMSPGDVTASTFAQDSAAALVERELRETRDRLQSMIEEYETALEELKSANEELVSVNEEMQSTNEELEASKEEMQSLNEELHTVNGELNAKVEALDEANHDLLNLFESTDVATLFLDQTLAIRSFTLPMAQIFNILPSDRGRPITDLSSRFHLPDLAGDISTVFAARKPVERRVENSDHSAHYLVRIAPYRDGGASVNGVVVTFLDISSVMREEARQAVLIAELQHRSRNVLAVVQSIAHQTFERGAGRDVFIQRVAALGRVQTLIGAADDHDIDLGAIVRQELQSLGSEDDPRITVTGEAIQLDYDQLQTFGLALHELATNAVKYGALSTDAGQLGISWQVMTDADAQRWLVLHWRESGVVLPRATARRGFGRQLIERALVQTLRARTKLQFDPDGVTCCIEVPLPALS